MRPILTNFVNTYISAHQHEFRSARSILTNLIEFVTDVMTEVDRGFEVDAVYTGFSSAFNKVNHELFILKLKCLNIHGSLLQWFSSYLAVTPQVVNIKGHVLEYYYARSGVPQGPILGLIFFTNLLTM